MKRRQAVSLDRGDPDDLDYGDPLELFRKPSSVIRWLQPELDIGEFGPCAGYMRVSDRSQDLDAAVRALKGDLLNVGIRVMKWFRGVESSSVFAERRHLMTALRYCADQGLPLVTSDRSRYLRASRFLRLPKEKRKLEFDLVEPYELTHLQLRLPPDVEIFTFFDPDVSERAVRTSQGIAEKRRKHGPGELQAKNGPLRDHATKLFREGRSKSEIVLEIVRRGGRPSTVYTWLAELKRRSEK